MDFPMEIVDPCMSACILPSRDFDPESYVQAQQAARPEEASCDSVQLELPGHHPIMVDRKFFVRADFVRIDVASHACECSLS